MKRVRIDNIEYVYSRCRNGVVELVDFEGRLHKRPEAEVPKPYYVHKPIIPGFIPLENRDVAFLEKLREARRIRLTKRAPRKTKGSETGSAEGSEGAGPNRKKPRSSGPSAGRGRRSTVAEASIIAKIKSLPAELRSAAATAMGISMEKIK